MNRSLMEFGHYKPWINKKVCYYCNTRLNCGYNPQRKMYFLACGKVRGKSHDIDMADPASIYHLRFNWGVEEHRIKFAYNYRFSNASMNYTTKYVDILMPAQIPTYWKNIMEIIKSSEGSSEDYVLF